MTIIWSPTARRRALEAVDYIEQNRPLGALEWLDGLISRIELLAESPTRAGSSGSGGNEAVREIIYDPYRVIYEVYPDHVHILTLSHSRRLLEEL